MSLECPGRGKFAQFMSYRILSYKNGYKFLAIMYSYGMPDHIGNNGRPPGPCFYNLLCFWLICLHNPFQQVSIYEWTFFNRTGHYFLLETIYLSVSLLLLVLNPLVGTPHGL